MKKGTRSNAQRPVMVTTEYRGVFFGYATDTTGDTVKLARARNVIYWPATQRGVVGLAATGPLDGARVGPCADVELRKVTAVFEVGPDAAARWEAAPWK
jgi:hypothetical protein